ncbi:MAG: DUF433 domain-containing protein [Chloroflexi bacterium]|nr:DUF433 domain-containing protein [Chloroflexota bacterium]
MSREIAVGITTDPTVLVGTPVIRGTRMPFELVLAKLSANPDVSELLLDYPHLTVDQIRDCLRFAAQLVANDERCGSSSPTTGTPETLCFETGTHIAASYTFDSHSIPPPIRRC